jgi:hypothetical protein
MNAHELISELKLAEISCTYELSHVWGSQYFTVDGRHFRVSNHSKKTDISYEYGVNDFNTVDDLRNRIIELGYNLSDKTELKNQFFAEYSLLCTTNCDGDIVTPNGAIFGTIENACSAAWRKMNNKTVYYN